VELMHAVGSQYLAKSKHYLAATGMFGALGGMWHSAGSSVHVIRETVSTVRAALELKTVFEELSKAEEQGITEDRKRQLEEAAAEKG
jgi:X-domain of DnaJ-containing